MEKKKPKLVIDQKKPNITKKPVIKKKINKLISDKIVNEVPPVPKMDKVLLYDPKTGEANKDYEKLTGKKNPLLESNPYNSKFIPPITELKKENRFLVYLPDSFDVEPININYLRLPTLELIKRKIFGVTYIKTFRYRYLEIEVREFIQTNFSNNILNIIKDNNNLKFNFKIEMLDPTGSVIEEWELTDCSINNITFGELEYSSDKARIIKLNITPNDIKIFKTN